MAADCSEDLSRLPKRLRTAAAVPQLAPPAGATGASRNPTAGPDAWLGGSNLGAAARPRSTSDAYGFPVPSSASIPRVGPAACSYNHANHGLLNIVNAAHGLGSSTATPHTIHTVPPTAGPRVSALPGLTSAPGPFGQNPLTAIPRLAAAATTPYSATVPAQATPLEPPATVPQRTQHIGPYSHIEASNRAGCSIDIPSLAAPRANGASRPACSSDSSSSGSCCCTICEEEYTEGGDHAPACLKCGHVFGQSCIRRWLSSFRKSCPLCQMANKTTDIRRLYNLPRLVVQIPAPPAAAPAPAPAAATAATSHPSTTPAPVAGTMPPGATPTSGVATVELFRTTYERLTAAATSMGWPATSGAAVAAAGSVQVPPALAAVVQPAPGRGSLTTDLPAASSTAMAPAAAAPPSAASAWAALLQPVPGQGGLGNELVLRHMVLSLSRDLALARAELVQRNLAAA